MNMSGNALVHYTDEQNRVHVPTLLANPPPLLPPSSSHPSFGSVTPSKPLDT